MSGTSPLVDVTSKQIGANIAEAEIAALPIMNKNWMFAVGLTPGIQVSSSTASFACESLIVGGGSNRSGNFSIDGAGNNDDYLGSSCGSQVRPALETVQEFQVLTNQYDAEFGRTAGAIVNAITKQGGNIFHGSLFGSFTNHAMTAEDFFVAQNNLDKPETKQTDWGGTIGGPVKKDKAHFFYSLDRLVYSEGRSNTFAARPELNYSNTQRMNLWNHMIRVDNQINKNHTWTGRFTIEKSPTYDRVAGRVTQAARDQEYDDDRLAGGSFNSIFGNNRFNTIRAGWTYEKNGFTDKRLQERHPEHRTAALARDGHLLRWASDGRAVPHQQFLRNFRRVLPVHPLVAGRRSRFEGRRPVHLFHHPPARPGGHERPVHLLDGSRLQPERPEELSGAAPDQGAFRQRHPDAEQRLRAVRAGQVPPRAT